MNLADWLNKCVLAYGYRDCFALLCCAMLSPTGDVIPFPSPWEFDYFATTNNNNNNKSTTSFITFSHRQAGVNVGRAPQPTNQPITHTQVYVPSTFSVAAERLAGWLNEHFPSSTNLVRTITFTCVPTYLPITFFLVCTHVWGCVYVCI
jgi:hypothetical protein